MRAAAGAMPIADEPLPGNPGDEHRRLMALVASRRDREAFRALYVHFGPRVKALMIRGGAGHAEADDLVQDVMMTVWRKVDLYVPERGSAGAWIFTIARNARIDRLRRGGSQPYQDIEDLDLASDGADGEDETFASQIAERVGEALAELPDDQRRVIELAFVEDRSQSEIADKLSLPLGTVKSRMRLAYIRLRDKLEDVK